MCFFIAKGNPRDRWNGTKVTPSGGEIKQPQLASSWLMGDLLQLVVECAQDRPSMSETQQEKVREAIRDSGQPGH